MAKQAADFLVRPLQELDLIVLHLGNGASVTAIEAGKSVHTSMGLTPLEGLVMGTRSGDVDPAVIFHISEQSDASLAKIDADLNERSGLEGLCGLGDVRDVQALSGTASVQADSETGAPRMVQQALCDKIAAYSAAQSITAALLARERGAGGQHLRVAMLDAALAFLWLDGMADYTILEDDVVAHPPASAAIRAFATRDGHIAVAPMTDAQAHGMFRALGREELIEDPRFAHVEARSRNAHELMAECSGELQKLTTEQAVDRLRNLCASLPERGTHSLPSAAARPPCAEVPRLAL